MVATRETTETSAANVLSVMSTIFHQHEERVQQLGQGLGVVYSSPSIVSASCGFRGMAIEMAREKCRALQRSVAFL